MSELRPVQGNVTGEGYDQKVLSDQLASYGSPQYDSCYALELVNRWPLLSRILLGRF